MLSSDIYKSLNKSQLFYINLLYKIKYITFRPSEGLPDDSSLNNYFAVLSYK